MSNAISEDVFETINHVAARWDGVDTRLLRKVFPLLAQGHPVTVEAIAAAAGTESDWVGDVLRQGRAQFDRRGRVIGLAGFGFSRTTHRIEINGVVLYCCCALFAHMIPQLVKETTIVESLDPITGMLVRLAIHPEGIKTVKPDTAVSSLVRARKKALMNDIGAAFCSHIHHFVSLDSAGQFASADVHRQIASIGNLHLAARYLVRRIWDK